MAAAAPSKKRPNVLLILADDLGFSDLGCFGGEIDTPNLDRLAAHGLRMTDFHTAAACSPTRAMLLSGTDHHVAGLGTMAERMTDDLRGRPGYEGHLNDAVAPLPELLQDAGYETLMAGKWHLGSAPGRGPADRGFERSFALLGGAHNHYGWEPAWVAHRGGGGGGQGHEEEKGEDKKSEESIPRIAGVLGRMYQRDGRSLSPDDLPPGFYSTDSFTDEMIGYLRDREARGEERPFFAYLALSAPHWPLQAPMETIRKYEGRYSDGPEALRRRRLAALKAGGLVPEHAVPAPVVSIDEQGRDTRRWEDMSPAERALSARKMEAYAGMVDRMDAAVGRLLGQLREREEDNDNTLVLFMSDNGAEGAMFEAWPQTAGGDMDAYVARWHDNSLGNIGQPDSFAWYGSRWASASTAPGLLYKMFTSEGGIRVPLIMCCPDGLVGGGAGRDSADGGDGRRGTKLGDGGIDHGFTTCMDILPTILDLCGVPPAGELHRGRKVAPVAGRSWLPYLRGDEPAVHGEDRVVGWELFGRRAVRQGASKATLIPKPFGPGRWQLFNILDDPGETADLAGQQPERLQAMVALYDQYCRENGVITGS